MRSKTNQTAIYRVNQRYELGYFQTWALMLKNLIEFRELVWEFFKRDLFGAYKKSFAGALWVVLSPLVGILTWIFFKHAGVLQPGNVGIPYPAYILIGSSMWGLFMGFYSSASQTLSAGSSFVMSVHYPHEIFLFEKTLLQLTNFLITLAINLGVLIFFGVIPSWGVFLLPLVALPLFFLGASIGLIMSMLSVVAIDANIIMSTLLGLVLLITPVIYSDQVSNELLRFLMQWNPLTYLVCSARDIVIYGRLYHPVGFFLSSAVSLGLFLLSWRLFYLAEDKIIERMI